MVTVNWKITRAPFANNTWGAEETLTELYDPTVRVMSGDGKDSFSFKVNNINGDYDNYFNPNDRIVVSRQQNSTIGFSDSDVIITGAIRSVPQEINSSHDLLRIEGYNYSETVMNSLVFVGGGVGKPIDVFLKDAINSARLQNSNFGVVWKDTNPTTKSDGNSFPVTTEKIFNRPLSYILEKYSVDARTEDGRYYWFVNKDNELVWDRRGDDTNGRSFNQDVDEFQSIKITKDVSEIKNYVIVKGGYAPDGSPIQKYVPDYPSIAKNGFRYYILTEETKTAESIASKDARDNGLDVLTPSDFAGGIDVEWHTGTYYVYSDYITDFKNYMKNVVLENVGRDFLSLRTNGKLKVDVTFQAGDKSWGLADQVSVTIPSLSSGSKLMRVEEIQYSTTTDTFTLVEDIGTL